MIEELGGFAFEEFVEVKDVLRCIFDVSPLGLIEADEV